MKWPSFTLNAPTRITSELSLTSFKMLSHGGIHKNTYPIQGIPWGIKGEVGVTSFRNATGENYLAYSKDYDQPRTIEVFKEWFSSKGYSGTIEAMCTLKKGFLPPRWRVNIDFAKLIWNDILSKLKKKNKEKVIPYPRFLSLLLEHEMEGYRTDEVSQGKQLGAKTGQRKKSTSLTTKHNPLSKIEATKKVQQATSGPTSLGVTGEGGSNPQLSSVKSTYHSKPVYSASTIIYSESASGHYALAAFIAKVDPGKSTPNYSLLKQQDKTQSVGYGLKIVHTKIGTKKEANYDQEEFNTSLKLTNSKDVKEIKMEDLSKLVKDVGINLMDLDSLEDDTPFINIKLEKEKASAKAEATLFKAQPFYPNVEQLTKLLISDINEAIRGLKQYVEGLEIEIPCELKTILEKLKEFQSAISGLTKQVAQLMNQKLEVLVGLLALLGQVSSITAQLSKLKVFDALSSLLIKVTRALNRFENAIALASQTTGDTSVPLASQVGTHLVEGEKNTKQATITHPLKITPQPEGELIKNKGKESMSHKKAEEKESKSNSDAETKLTGSMVESSKKKHLKKKEEVIDLLGLDVVTNMYKAKVKSTKTYKSSVQYEDHPAGTILNEPSLDFTKGLAKVIMLGPSVPS
ncbi:hypothetical protein Tco_0468934 [Tanacetum coccineum]